MTHFTDPLRQGAAYFEGAQKWNTPGTTPNGLPLSTSPSDTQNLGAPHTQMFAYQMGTVSTPLASGVFFTTASTGSGTLTATGALVTSGVATFDIPRQARITASTNLATCVITLRGTDGYGQSLTWQGIGPSGNVLGSAGSFVDTASAFKTITTASFTGLASAGIQIGSSPNIGLPYVLTNKGMSMGLFVDGATASIAPTLTNGFTPTGTPTASTADVRGIVAPATTSLPDGTKLFTFVMVTPNTNTTINTDNRVNTFGAVPFSS